MGECPVYYPPDSCPDRIEVLVVAETNLATWNLKRVTWGSRFNMA